MFYLYLCSSFYNAHSPPFLALGLTVWLSLANGMLASIMQAEAGKSACLFPLALMDSCSHHENVPGLAGKRVQTRTWKACACERHVGEPSCSSWGHQPTANSQLTARHVGELSWGQTCQPTCRLVSSNKNSCFQSLRFGDVCYIALL